MVDNNKMGKQGSITVMAKTGIGSIALVGRQAKNHVLIWGNTALEPSCAIRASTDTARQWTTAWFENPEAFLLGCIGLMTLLGVTQYEAGPVKAVYWVLCAPVTLWVFFLRGGFRQLWRSVAMRWAFGLLLLYVVSVFWSVPTTHAQQVSTVNHTNETALFIITLFFALGAPAYQRLQFARLLIVCCVAGALTAIVSFYLHHPVSERLTSQVYLLDWPTIGPPVLLGCLMSAGLLMDKHGGRGCGYWLLAGFLCVGVYVFMTQTRAALLTFACLAFLWTGYHLGLARAFGMLAILCVSVIVAVAAVHSLDEAWVERLATGLNGRVAIWTNSWNGFLHMPWLGHGAASIFLESPSGKATEAALSSPRYHPHSMSLSMLFYFGVTGLVLWLGYLFALARRLWCYQEPTKWLGFSALLCLLLITATDFNKVIAEMGVEWWFWWLPCLVILAVADDTAGRRRQGALIQPASPPRPWRNRSESRHSRRV